MAVSAPPTPAHTERLMKLQSESLAWLDKEVINSDNLDASKSNQVNFDSNKEDKFFNTSNDLINLNGIIFKILFSIFFSKYIF